MSKLDVKKIPMNVAAGRPPLELINLPEPATIFEIYINNLAPSGRSGIRSLLNVCANRLQPSYTADTYPWQYLSYASVSKLRAELLDSGYSVASVNMALAALRGLAKVAFNLGNISADELSRIQAVRRVRGSAVRKGRSLSRVEIRGLLKAARKHTSVSRRARDRALVMVASGAGLRAAELVSLAYEHFDQKSGVLNVMQGKGRKQRSIHLARPIQLALIAWLAKRGHEAGPFFTKISRAGSPSGLQLTKSGLTDILQRLATTAQVPRFTPHDLRRTFITHLLEAGVDINTVRQLAGHSNIATTAAYDFRSEKAKISASKAFSCW